MKNSPVDNSDAFINTANNSKIRLFNNNRSASLSPKIYVEGNWEEAKTEPVTEFSAIGYHLAGNYLKP